MRADDFDTLHVFHSDAKVMATLGGVRSRDDTQRVLTANYPQSQYLSNGFRSKDDPWWKLW